MEGMARDAQGRGTGSLSCRGTGRESGQRFVGVGGRAASGLPLGRATGNSTRGVLAGFAGLVEAKPERCQVENVIPMA
jgi:hypothetical protein